MSQTNFRWIHKPNPNPAKVQALAQAINLSEPLAALLVQRGIETFEEAKAFFRPDWTHLHDPLLMKDMPVAVERLERALAQGEKILIYGDYDVDGTTAVALVYGFLRQKTHHIAYYVPDRYAEGYGISWQSIEWAAKEGFSLIIALDCGIKAVELILKAQGLGLDYIICDHHLPAADLPQACAVLDPKRQDCNYPYKELSGCGVGFKLLQGLCLKMGWPLEQLYPWAGLCALSIAADIVPVTGENRVLATLGLNQINQTPTPGLQALIQVAGFKNPQALNIRNLVFGIAPRINAAGRIEHARKAVQLLVSQTAEEAEALAAQIDQNNQDRRLLDQRITEEALAMIAEEQVDKAATVLFKPDWHKGVIGIVASRCIEHYYRPTVILTEHEGKLTGSARSIRGFDLYEALSQCHDLMLQFGGHRHAAGMTLLPENLPAFRERFERVTAELTTAEMRQPVLEIDLELKFDFLTLKRWQVLQQFAPFGPENMTPVFCSTQVMALYPKIINERHLKFMAKQEGCSATYDVIGFDMAHYYEQVLQHKRLSISYQIGENTYQGNTSLQLYLKDVKF
ncbi:single-stranded-DNA-specific exonuclease RecJ [Eisenibacter elegans]|jgi:single-stranded-DNA-specific exonuclease|uniref:single-stranded-DNA-specific exonuclease RecJ n=1 Tax=Eisenibacter elegans TaxID=997 RepID=UPI000419DB9E|nr:single-stranded-DNA-specific exonuclease RecJ [Eisenibacter elegans]